MPSTILRSPINKTVQDVHGNAVYGATATIYVIPGSADATIYDAAAGAGTIANPTTTTATGQIEGYLEIGIYDIRVEDSNGTVTSRYYASHPEQSLLQGTALTDSNLEMKDDDDTYPRFAVNAGGTIAFGDGSGTADAFIYRSGAGTITIDSYFNVSAGINVQDDDFALAVKLNNEVYG